MCRRNSRLVCNTPANRSFSKSKLRPANLKTKVETTTSNHSYYSSRCSHYYSGCGAKKSSTAEKTKSQNKGWSLRLQPSAGIGFIPSNVEDLVINPAGSQNNYIYNAGNNKTTFLTGMGFEFAKNEKRLFTLSVNYFKGLGDNATSFTSESAGKTTTTMLNSKLSGWGATLGIPISFTKKDQRKTEGRTKAKIRLSEIQNGMQVSMQKNYLNGRQ